MRNDQVVSIELRENKTAGGVMIEITTEEQSAFIYVNCLIDDDIIHQGKSVDVLCLPDRKFVDFVRCCSKRYGLHTVFDRCNEITKISFRDVIIQKAVVS